MRRYQLAVSSHKVNVDGRILGTESKFWFPRLRSNLCSVTLVLGGMWVEPDEESDRWNLSPRFCNRTYQVLWWGLANPYVSSNLGKSPLAVDAMTGKNEWRCFDLISCLRLRFTCAAARFVHCSWFQDFWLPPWYLPIRVLLMLI